MSYEETMLRYEKVTLELPLLEKKLKEMNTELASLKKSVSAEKQKIATIQSQSAQIQKEAMTKKTKLERDLTAEMKRLSVKKRELQDVADLPPIVIPLVKSHFDS